METVLREFRYKPRWAIIFSAGTFFGLCTAVAVWAAVTNDRGLIINGIIELSPNGATIFWWCVAAASMAFVLGAGFLIYSRLTTNHRIALTPSCLLVPLPRHSREEAFIPFAEVTQIQPQDVNGARFLTLYYSGMRFTLVESWMPSKSDFEELSKIIHERVGEKGDQNT